MSGLPKTSWNRPGAKLRLAGVALAALLASILMIWVNRTTWERAERLQGEFAGLKADSFYIGVRMRSDIQRMNDTLLRYRLRGDPTDADAFHAETQAFKNWLGTGRTNAVTAMERDLFERARVAYDEYLVESTAVLEANRARWQTTRALDFQDSYEKVQAKSEYLLKLCDTFIDAQRAAFDDFLAGSKATVKAFRWLLPLSLVLMVALIAALVMLVYRGMIAPLRFRLTESQAIIARQEKLASLGVLAAGVAHEIRNPLTAIKFRLFSLKKTLPAAGSNSEDAVVIGGEINRLERIVDDFLQFARPSEPELTSIPALRTLQEVHDLLAPQLQKLAIELKVEASDSVWVRMDTQQIKQVLINLVQNSADSIGRNGVITLRAWAQPRSSRRGVPARVVLQVADNGRGIPPDVQQRLFDPFFTTKEGGTGLGLPIAARIVEKHGGELRYETEMRRGTTFSVILPNVYGNETQNSAHRG